MQLRADQLAQHLKQATQRGGLKPIYTVWGDEPLQAMEAGDALRAAARAAGYTERQVHTVSGAHFQWDMLLGASQAMSLFADRQLIEIRIPSGKPGKDGSDALQRYCSGPAAEAGGDVITLVQLPRLDRQQQQSAWFMALDQAGVTVRVDPIERKALPGWIAQRLAAQGQRAEDGEAGLHALNIFADRVEGNLLAAHQEIQKLALLYPAGELSAEQIEGCVLPHLAHARRAGIRRGGRRAGALGTGGRHPRPAARQGRPQQRQTPAPGPARGPGVGRERAPFRAPGARAERVHPGHLGASRPRV